MSEEQDDATRGYRGIPDDSELESMSFIALSELLSSCEKDSTKFHVVERELKKCFAQDQAKINRFNIILGACMGGFFGLAGVALGAYLKNSPSPEQVTPSAAVQQIQNPKLTVKPPITDTAPVSQPAITQPAADPTPVKSNAQPSQPHP